MKKISWLILSALVFVCGTASQAQTKLWPKEIPFTKTDGKVLIYQPQPDALEGNTLTGRAAIAGKEKAKDELVFGAIFFEAKLFTDKATRMASLESFKITNAKITGLDDQEKLAKLIALIETEVPKWELDISIDELVATIKKDHPNAEVYNNDPPKIIYREKPTTLVILDGEPKVKKDKDLDADRVVNSPNLIFKEGNQWNMYLGGIWYKSAQITTGWTSSATMSKKVKSINDQIKKQEKEANDNKEVTAKPVVTDIIVSTEPAEILQTKGAPVFKKIDSTSLEYVSNSTNDIFKTTDGTIYILIAGRWYKSASFNGPWVFNESDKMPADFARIPEGSDKDNVLVSISGTPEAEEAIIDAEIPQTAKVDRKTATVKVEYDGEPKFEDVPGTSLQLAANSNLTILKDGATFFALDNGVWFIGTSAKGPWKVSDTRPGGLESISPKSPAYNAKFVSVYESTPEYVVVGYTGGYLGNYIQGDPTIVFGTGFYYAPWYGSIYYPRPVTWGFSFCYNPYTGWTMGYGFNVGFLHVGIGFGFGYGYGGWFGPPYYRPPYYRPPYYGGGYYGHGGYHGGHNNITINNNHNNIYNRPGNGNGNNNRPGISGNRPGNGNNNGNRPGGNYRPGNNAGSNNKLPNTNNRPANNTRPVAKPAPGNNNVFADRDGNAFQKDNKGNINQRDNKTNSWKPTNNAPSYNPVNRDMQSRDRGNQRTNNFNNNSRPATRPSSRPSPQQRPAARPAPSRGRRN